VTVAVLGSNSFAGGHLIRALLDDDAACRVVGISRSPQKSAIFLPP
jgi:nucleoside-diphosphate-sugar epimerase